MRLGAPVLGPTLLIACRVFFAAVFLAIVGAALRKPLDARRNALHYLVLGLFNSALPFLLFAFAARTLSASLLSILNATAPIWGAAFAPPAAMPSPADAVAVLALGVVCSGIAYLLYFRLIADVGAASALTVTFLVPVFGVLWGHLALDEPLGWNTLVGALVVIAGTALVTGFCPRALFARTATA